MSKRLGDYMCSPGDLRIDKSKITKYLLSTEHPIGKGKEKFFSQRGFSSDDWQYFANALREHARSHPIANIEPSEYGVKYVVDCSISGPKDDDYCVRVVWNDHEDGEPPILVTAHPLSR